MQFAQANDKITICIFLTRNSPIKGTVPPDFIVENNFGVINTEFFLKGLTIRTAYFVLLFTLQSLFLAS